MEMRSGGLTVIIKLKYASVCGSLPKHNYTREKDKGDYRAGASVGRDIMMPLVP